MSLFTVSLALLTLIGAPPAVPVPLDAAAPQELRYHGAVLKVSKDEDVAIKRFSIYYLLSPRIEGARQMAFVVNERGAGNWSWAERYGSVGLDGKWQATGTRRPRLLYDHQGIPTPVAVPLPVLPRGIDLKAGDRWVEGDENRAGGNAARNREVWEVVGRKTVLERDCWQIEVKNNFGRKRTVFVDVKSPLVVSLEERFFVGQGEEHKLTMQLLDSPKLTDQEYTVRRRPVQSLLKLQSDLKRPEGESRPELSAAQQKTALAALRAGLPKDATDTAFSELVSAIQRDVDSQQARTAEITKLADQFLGRPAPKFSLIDLQKQPIPAADRSGKIVVLHFWEYQGEPLVEPYGQVGYLDFLHEKRRKLGVQVYGVAVDGRISDPQFSAAAMRSIHKLKSSMNLSYPIALDDGKLLDKFGDPRSLGAKLPLWVVIGPDGKVAHYRSGFYKINPDEGLQELDAALIPLIRARAQKAATQ